jgi:hypothetical protein
MNVGREYFEAVLQRSNCETKGRLHKLSESSGFGGTMCAGMSISAVGAHLSTEATELSPEKTNHYRKDFPSDTLVFRLCPTR